LRKSREFVGQAYRSRQRLTPGYEPVRNAHSESLFAMYAAPREDQIHGLTVAEKSRKPDRAEIEQGHSEPPAEDSKHGILRSDAHVAPQR
jgi:hypothetical protein